MGVGFECGCRVSCDAWHLCEKHEDIITAQLQPVIEEQ